jgi:hypothetical protein
MFDKISQFVKKNHQQNWFCLSVIFVAVCYVMMPLLLLGIPRGADLTQHLQFASTYQHAILAGDFFPGWAASDNNGFGSIGIRFYPPVAYYLMAFTQMLTSNWYETFWTNAFFWMFLGSIGVYLWAREWLSPIEAALAAVFYAFAPYHRFQIFKLILFAEFAAAGILPFCFWLLTRVIRQGRWIDAVFLAIALALLILTHIPTTILGLIGLTVYGLLMMDWSRFRETFLKLVAAGGLALVASSYHWIRLVSELDWVKHTAENYTVDFYDYRQHLFPLALHLRNYMPPLDEAIILLILCLLPLAVICVLHRKVKWRDAGEKRLLFALLGTGVVCALMTTGLSLPIWEKLSFLQKVQFPWRWLSIGSLIAPLALVFGFTKLYRSVRRRRRSWLYAGLIVLAPVFIYYLYLASSPPLVFNRTDFAAETEGLSERKGCSCWWPSWADRRAFEQRERVAAGNRRVKILEWEGESRFFEVAAGDPVTIRIATFYYPHWRASVDGRPVEIDRTETGLISIPIPEQTVAVRIYFQESRLVTTAYYFAALTWLFIFLRLLSSYFPRSPLYDTTQEHAK